jgi:hypothetical protein
VTLVLRLIRQSRWDSPEKFDWLEKGNIPADPLADFANTNDNCLSVWFVDDEKKDLDDVVAALAASREKADKLDFALFPQGHLKAAGIEVRKTIGQTPDKHVNTLHRDLIRLSAEKVLALTTKVWHENFGLIRFDQRMAVQLVATAVSRGRISLEDLRPKLREDARSCLGEKRGGLNAPK